MKTNFIPPVNLQAKILENTEKILKIISDNTEAAATQVTFTDEVLVKELSKRGKDARSIGAYLAMKKEDVEKILSL
jgi:nitrogen regulatory protein PII-like uncharacterized protein